MNKNSFILATSGFILPSNPYFDILGAEKIEDTSILNRNVVINADSSLSDYAKDNAIHYSTISNDAFHRYMTNKDFNSFIQMLDIATSVLSEINYKTFFELQANNRNMSPMTFMMCLDIYTGNFVNKHLQYATIPASARFVTDDSITTDIIRKNLTMLNKIEPKYLFWEGLLSDIGTNRDAFCTFFKYIFTDSYS